MNSPRLLLHTLLPVCCSYDFAKQEEPLPHLPPSFPFPQSFPLLSIERDVFVNPEGLSGFRSSFSFSMALASNSLFCHWDLLLRLYSPNRTINGAYFTSRFSCRSPLLNQLSFLSPSLPYVKMCALCKDGVAWIPWKRIVERGVDFLLIPSAFPFTTRPFSPNVSISLF